MRLSNAAGNSEVPGSVTVGIVSKKGNTGRGVHVAVMGTVIDNVMSLLIFPCVKKKMNNLLAGTSNCSASSLYPEQNLTTQSLHTDYGYNACDACNLVPPQPWSTGACNACVDAPYKYYHGTDVGDPHMTGTQEFVPTPGQYVPQPVLQKVAACDLTQTARNRGISWQSYNLSSVCGMKPQ